MSLKAKAVLLLMLLSMVLTELVSGSTRIFAFLNPFQLIFLILGYGLAVLALREYIVRRSVGLMGMMFLGLAYGIYNEGLWAKTMILPDHLPILQFDLYGRFIDINFAWTLFICLYHALAAVVLPILIVHLRYPELRDTPWMSKRGSMALGIGLFALSVVSFLSPLRLTGAPFQLVVLLFLMAAAIAVSRIAPGKKISYGDASVSLNPFFIGLSVFLPYVILPSLAERHVVLPVFFGVVVFFVLLYAWLLGKGPGAQKLLMFGLGFYTQTALMGIIFGLLMGAPDQIVVDLTLICIFLYHAFKLRYRHT